jgi:chromosome segregation ATPase
MKYARKQQQLAKAEKDLEKFKHMKDENRKSYISVKAKYAFSLNQLMGLAKNYRALAEDTKIEIEDLKQEIEDLKKEIESQKEEIEDCKHAIDVQKQEIGSQKQEIEIQKNEIEIQKQELDECKDEILDKNLTIQSLEHEKSFAEDLHLTQMAQSVEKYNGLIEEYNEMVVRFGWVLDKLDVIGKLRWQISEMIALNHDMKANMDDFENELMSHQKEIEEFMGDDKSSADED